MRKMYINAINGAKDWVIKIWWKKGPNLYINIYILLTFGIIFTKVNRPPITLLSLVLSMTTVLNGLDTPLLGRLALTL